jgi:predicted ATPase
VDLAIQNLTEPNAKNTEEGDSAAHAFAPNGAELSILSIAEQEGLIVNCGHKSYKWEHDKVHEASRQLLDPDESKAVRFEVGKLLLDKLDEDELGDCLFVVANLLSVESDLIDDDDEELRERLLKLNLRAGKSALECSAFESAARYLKNGIALLPEKCWENYPEVTLELYSNGAEAYYCSGYLNECKEFSEVIISRTNIPLVQKQRAVRASHFSLGHFQPMNFIPHPFCLVTFP